MGELFDNWVFLYSPTSYFFLSPLFDFFYFSNLGVWFDFCDFIFYLQVRG